MSSILFYASAYLFLCCVYFGDTQQSSTGYTTFKRIALKPGAGMTETKTEMENCTVQCMKKNTDPKQIFCVAFAFVDSECKMFNSENEAIVDATEAYYLMIDFMNAPKNKSEACSKNYTESDIITADMRQTYSEGVHYIYFVTNLSMTSCLEKCQGLGFSMASVHTQQENQFIGELNNGYGRVFIGLSRNQLDQNLWYWSDGTPVDYLNWDQQSNMPRDQNCAIIGDYYGTFFWQAYPCSDKYNCLCARPVA